MHSYRHEEQPGAALDSRQAPKSRRARLLAAGLLCASLAGGLLACRNDLYSVASQKKNFTLTVNAGYGGRVRATGKTGAKLSLDAGNGEAVALTALPNPGYVFAGWKVAKGPGSLSSASAATTDFTVEGSDASVSANFAFYVGGGGGGTVGVGDTPANLTLVVAGSTTISKTGSAGYVYGAMVGVTNVKSDITSIAWYLDGSLAVSATQATAPSGGLSGTAGSGVTASGSLAADCGITLDGTTLASGGYELSCEVVYRGFRYSASMRVNVTASPEGTLKYVRTIASGSALSDPALSPNGYLYVGSSVNSDLTVYEADSGGMTTLTWSATIPSHPVVDRDGRIAFNSANQAVLMMTSGARIFSPSYSLNGSPAIGNNGYFYARTLANSLYVLREQAGSIVYANTTTVGVTNTTDPSIGPDGRVYMGNDDGNLYAFTASGAFLWSFPTGGSVRSRPAIASDGTIYVGSDTPGVGSLFAINPGGGMRWRRDFGSWGPSLHSGVVISPDESRIYITGRGAGGVFVYAVGANNTFTSSDQLTFGSSTTYGSLAIAKDGALYFTCGTATSGSLRKILDSPAGLALDWTYNVPTAGQTTDSSSPVIGPDGTVFFTATDGTNGYVYAVYGSSGPATTGWAMLGKNARRSGCASDAQ